jgi:hypothetical protein
MTWATNNGWEYSSWGIISGKSGLAHARAIVYDEGSCVFVTHLEGVIVVLKIKTTDLPRAKSRVVKSAVQPETL